MLLADWFKTAVMKPLQERVVELGVCPKCHSKTLQSKHMGGEIEWLQCSGCLTVYGLPEETRRMTKTVNPFEGIEPWRYEDIDVSVRVR